MSYPEYRYSDAQSWHSSHVEEAVRKMLGRPGGPVLDIGCGNGALVQRLLNDGLDAYGVDLSPSGIAHAAASYPGRFFTADVNDGELPQPLREIPFRAVISTEVIEHLYQPRRLLDAAATILRRAGGGRLVISTPYHGYLKNVLIALAGRYDAHHTAHWDGGHIKFFSRATLEKMLRDQGFTPAGFIGCGRVPWLWKSMVLAGEIGTE
jgi:2-polyprenyl-6-hydroxyphenyl methylase/3-demethylubiquinone-9 3-methyltransferase